MAKRKKKAAAKPKATRKCKTRKGAPRKGVSPAAYAKHAGVSRQAIMVQIEQRQIVKSVWKAGRYWKIDPAGADQERAQNLELRRDVPVEDREPLEDLDLALEMEGEPTLTKAKMLTEISKGKIEHLRLLEIQAQLVRADVVERERFNLGRLVRDALLAVPAIVGPEAASMSDAKEVTIMFERELVKALSDLTAEQLGGVA